MNRVPSAVNDDARNSSAYPAGYGMEPATYGVFDKPADRRLAPWITLGSIILGLFAACLIVFTFVKQGSIHYLWALFVSGIILGPVAVLGFLAGTSRRSQLAGLFFWAFLAGFIGSAILMIINAARLDINMEHDCNDHGFARATSGCQNIRQYYIIVYTALGAFFGTWVPTFLITSAYFWRITRLYRKEPYEGARHDAYGNRYNVGHPAL